MMDTSIADFHKSFYVPQIKNILFHLSFVQILGTNHCGNTHQEALKSLISHQYLLCCCEYAERLAASFAHKIQYEYYETNRSVSVEVITM